MAAKKHSYEIKLNGGSVRGRTFTYDYGTTKGISLHIAKNGASASFELSVQKTLSDFTQMKVNVFRDLMRKVYLIHSLIFVQPLKIKSISISIDGKTTNIDPKEKHFPFVFSMIDDRDSMELGAVCDHKRIIDAVLSNTKTSSEKNKQLCALYAFILSKCQRFETDRFMILWTAMNAYMNVIAIEYENRLCEKIGCQRKDLSNGKRVYKIDNAAIGALICLIQPGTLFPKKPDEIPEYKTAYRDINKELFGNQSISSAELYDAAYDDLYHHVRSERYADFFTIADSLHLSLYVFLLLIYPYRLRCDYIHGSKVLPIVASFVDPEIRDLNVVNTFLDRYLSENIPRIFDGQCLTESQYEQIEAFVRKR